MLDVFSHFTPRPVLDEFQRLAPGLPALAAFERLPQLWDIAARIESLEPFDGLQQILNVGNPPVDALGSPDVAAALARRANDELAAIVDRHADRFPGFTACLPMSDVDAALDEIDRSVLQLGARGVQIYSNVNGVPPSAPEFRPVFRRMAELDLPILIHPYRGPQVPDFPTESFSEGEVWFTFGWPYDTTACAARLVHSGLFTELPDVKIVLHHMGGMIPFFAGRIGLGFEQIFGGDPHLNPVAARAGIVEPLPELFRRFWADTALNGSCAAVRCGHDFFGSSRSLFGTDAPFSTDGGPTFVQGAIDAIAALPIDEEERRQILDENGRTLFGLGTAA